MVIDPVVAAAVAAMVEAAMEAESEVFVMTGSRDGVHEAKVVGSLTKKMAVETDTLVAVATVAVIATVVMADGQGAYAIDGEKVTVIMAIVAASPMRKMVQTVVEVASEVVAVADMVVVADHGESASNGETQEAAHSGILVGFLTLQTEVTVGLKAMNAVVAKEEESAISGKVETALLENPVDSLIPKRLMSHQQIKLMPPSFQLKKVPTSKHRNIQIYVH